MDRIRVNISKFLSYILRHNPARFNLRIDKNGYIDINDILAILKKRFQGFTKEELLKLVKQGSKGRFEVLDDKIRATYGHSISIELPNLPVRPPVILYHGTSKEALTKILKEGLKPMRRQFVHLSKDWEGAFKVGLRHTRKPVILKISTQQAYREGIEFFKEANTYLARFIPKKYIRSCAD